MEPKSFTKASVPDATKPEGEAAKPAEPTSEAKPTKRKASKKQTTTKSRFKVHLNATTPLAHNPATVEAETAEEAWRAYCKLNGISGSKHERTIKAV